VDGPATTLGLADHQHAGLIMKASRFHDPGPKPTRYVVFGPGSWKSGHIVPEATTARHSRNIRTTTAVATSQGLMVMGKANPDEEVLRAVVDSAFTGLG